MNRLQLLTAIIILIISGCVEKERTDLFTYDIKSELSDSTIVYPQLYEVEERYNPANFSLQSNSGGLVANPLTPTSGYSLYYFEHEELTSCCSQMTGLMRSGRGPGESGIISDGTQTPERDTLVYYSINTSRFYHFDQDLNLIDDPIVYLENVIVTDQLAYRSGKYYTENTFSDDEKILKVYNSQDQTTIQLIDYRIPNGYQPAARNNIASITSTPEFILLAIIGEKEILLIDRDEELSGKIKLGENDPLPTPFKRGAIFDVQGSISHIYKMEYHDDKIFILMKSGLIVLDRELNFIDRIVFYNENIEKHFISDFSINDYMLYLREGRSALYRVNYSLIKNLLSQN